MTTRQRPADVGTLRVNSVLAELGRELRGQRLDHGLSEAAVARAARTSRSQVSRLERAKAPNASLHEFYVLCSVLGLDLSVKVYPAGSPIRDVAHRALIDRFLHRLHPSVLCRFEVPLPAPGDRRTWDCGLLLRTQRDAVEAETHPRDVQALQRRVQLKRKDDPTAEHVLLVLSDTRYNRNLMREHGEALRADLPGDPREILAALKAGEPIRQSAILLL